MAEANTVNISRIIEVIEAELATLDAHLKEVGRNGALRADTIPLIQVQFLLRQTVATAREICPPLTGSDNYIHDLESGS